MKHYWNRLSYSTEGRFCWQWEARAVWTTALKSRWMKTSIIITCRSVPLCSRSVLRLSIHRKHELVARFSLLDSREQNPTQVWLFCPFLIWEDTEKVWLIWIRVDVAEGVHSRSRLWFISISSCSQGECSDWELSQSLFWTAADTCPCAWEVLLRMIFYSLQ